MRGQRKPTILKIKEGEPNKNRINFNEPQPKGKTTPPKFLNHWGKNEWKRIVPELESLGLFTKVDRSSLAAYCQAYGRWVDAENEYYKSPSLTIINFKGGISKNPILTVINECLNQMREYLTEFGMTPVSRSKINTAPKAKEVDPMEELLSGIPASEQ